MNTLTNREMQVADLIHQGKIEKEIATELNVSYQTARTHTKNIRRKLQARNAADITRIYLLQLKPYALVIIMAAIAAACLLKHPHLFEAIKTSLSTFLTK